MNPEKKSANVWKIYTEHTSRHRWLLAGVIVMNILAALSALAAPWYIRAFIDTVAANAPSPDVVQNLISILLILIGLWLANLAAHRIQYLCTMYIEVGVMTDLYHTSFNYLLRHSHNFFVSHFAGSLTHRVSKFGRSYEFLFDSIVNQLFPTLIFIVGALVVVSVRNLSLGIILTVWALCFLAFQIYVSHLRNPVRVERSRADSRLTGNLADAVSNQSTITLFSGVRYESGHFERSVAIWRDALFRSWKADAWIWTGMGLFMIVIQAVLFYGGITLWQKGLFTVGDFVLIQAYLLSTFQSMERMNRDLRKMNDAYSDAIEMAEVLQTPHEVRDTPGARPLYVSDGAISFKDVRFRFYDEQAIFTSFDLNIGGSEKVALVGPSGAGKSTITKLILRLFDVKGGAVEIDGQNIADVTQESLRNSIAFVPQEPVLFHRTLMENIRYGRRDATDDEVIEAAKKAHCHEFISKLSQQYETHVGERGVKLSGGERQRVAIARAILKNAPILILDEATSSLDSESEVLIQDALTQLMSGKTVLVIAHRLSTIMRMDRIVALDGGTITEQGTHAELLAKNGLYAQLWRHQAGGFIPDEEGA